MAMGDGQADRTVRIPDVFHDMLRSKAVAFISTTGKRGEPQVTPQWFLWDGEAVRISLVEGRQKLRNLRRDPRIAVAIADPADPTFYLELRGSISALVPDPGCTLEREIAHKYTGVWDDSEPSGPMRFATSVVVERTTCQLGFDIEAELGR
jgi:PPOX class probable F420-dependent enzyme